MRAYLPTAIVILLIVAAVGLGTWRAAHPIPPSQRAFKPDWRCQWIGNAELCERAKP